MGGICSTKNAMNISKVGTQTQIVEKSDIPLPPAFFEEYSIYVKKKEIEKAKVQNLAHQDIDNVNGGILGAGSFSIVLKCKHKGTGDIRAVKYVEKKRMIGLRSKRIADKIINEVHRGITLLRGLNHPNIIKLYDFFESTRAMAVVLEYGHGGELYHYVVKKKFLTEFQTVQIMAQLVSAIAYLHSKGYVHRDIKPENVVMLDANPDKEKDYRIKLIDFGYSRHMNNRMVSFVGTLNYVAPEILKRTPYDESVDIWSLGVIVFVLLQGYLPFDLSGHNDDYSLYLDPDDFKHVSNEGKEFLKSMLKLNPRDRPKASKLLKHPWLNNNMHRNRRESLQGLSSPLKLAGMVSPEKSKKGINKKIEFDAAENKSSPSKENNNDMNDDNNINTETTILESTYVTTNAMNTSEDV